jgi:hypothetical protein
VSGVATWRPSHGDQYESRFTTMPRGCHVRTLSSRCQGRVKLGMVPMIVRDKPVESTRRHGRETDIESELPQPDRVVSTHGCRCNAKHF